MVSVVRKKQCIKQMKKTISFKAIGTIHTPYSEVAPFRADENLIDGEYIIVVDTEFEDALYKLDCFNYIQVLFYIDKAKEAKLRVHPPYENAGSVGLFASRSPNRFNPIGLSTVKIIKIEKNLIFTSCLDVLNNTPLLDIKPYIPHNDLKTNANSGWFIKDKKN
jgi:tRNA (adenine37-N6)-methyltransferase